MNIRRVFWIMALLGLMIGCALPRLASAQSQTHVVQPGETLFHIALTYGLTTDQLAAANNITDPTMIYVGQVLVIPSAGAPAAPNNPAPVVNTGAAPTASFTYTVQGGDTLSIISRKFNVSLAAILSANPLTDPDHIVPGQTITIPGSNPGLPSANNAVAPNATVNATVVVVTSTPAPVTATAQPVQPTAQASQPASTGRTHVVQAGEGLAAIGRQYGISWAAIAAANNINDPNTIYVGQVLQIPDSDIGAVNVPGAPSTAPSTNAPAVSSTLDKEIVVVLHEQRIYVYEKGQMIRTSLVSTGLPGSPTVQGDFHIYVKYTAQLMVGPGYYLPGVPWVMYFYEGYGLHGTYWHNNFGHPMSHGCVNLPTPEAEWLYNWAEVGTLVHVQW
jgi:LysM repeat protein